VDKYIRTEITAAFIHTKSDFTSGQRVPITFIMIDHTLNNFITSVEVLFKALILLVNVPNPKPTNQVKV